MASTQGRPTTAMLEASVCQNQALTQTLHFRDNAITDDVPTAELTHAHVTQQPKSQSQLQPYLSPAWSGAQKAMVTTGSLPLLNSKPSGSRASHADGAWKNEG